MARPGSAGEMRGATSWRGNRHKSKSVAWNYDFRTDAGPDDAASRRDGPTRPISRVYGNRILKCRRSHGRCLPTSGDAGRAGHPAGLRPARDRRRRAGGGSRRAPTGRAQVGFTIMQPVPFSHQHHVAGLGIDCRFCHASVEVSANAGHAADLDLHDLPFANLDQRGSCWRRCAKPGRRTSRWSGAGSTTCRTTSTSITPSTSPRASAARPVTGAVDQMPLTYKATIADDGILPGLPSRSWASAAPGERDLQHELASHARHAVAGRVAGATTTCRTAT